MLQVLKDISGNRMPSVADLLKQAAQAPSGRRLAPKAPAARRPARTGPAGATASRPRSAPSTKPAGPVPTVADRESQQQPPEHQDEGRPRRQEEPVQRQLKLPTTTLAGASPARPSRRPTPPRSSTRRSRQQRDLLAEFEKVADELNRVLANLEGSTLVKRLKAASRAQDKIAGRIDDGLDETFGVAQNRVKPEQAKVLAEMGRGGGQGEPRRLQHHGRPGRLLRAAAVRPVQVGARRDAAEGRHRRPPPARRRPPEGERPLDRPVRVLVGLARPLGRGPRRPGQLRVLPRRQVAGQPAPVDRPGSAPDPRSRDQPPRRNPRRRAGPARPRRRASIAKQADAAFHGPGSPPRPGRQGHRADPRAHRRRGRVRQRDRPARRGRGGHARAPSPSSPGPRPAHRPSPPRPRRSS